MRNGCDDKAHEREPVLPVAYAMPAALATTTVGAAVSGGAAAA